MIDSISITHVNTIGDNMVLVCMSGVRTEIHRHKVPYKKSPFAHEWWPVAILREAYMLKLCCSLILDDVMILAFEQGVIQMYDRHEFFLIDYSK